MTLPSEPHGNPAIETVIVPRARDVGGFEVRRALPSVQRQMVGPFIFFDQAGPAEFLTGEGIDVRPHPHIGLATLAYLYDGELFHRDNLGSQISVRPGDVACMTAGRGVVHSERTGEDVRAAGHRLFGIQSWLALPKTHEDSMPAFEHIGRAELPTVEDKGRRVRVIAGTAFGATSPVKTVWETLCADVVLAAGAKLPIDPGHEERAVYTLSGVIDIAGDRFDPGRLLVFRPGDSITVEAVEDARFMLLGGDAMDGPRHIWWNFVHSDRDRIEAAKADWAAMRYDRVPDDEAEFIPLPQP